MTLRLIIRTKLWKPLNSFLYSYSFNDTDNPTPSKIRSISDTNPPQNSNKPSVRVTSNPRHTSYPHIPPVVSESSSSNSNASSSSLASKNNSTNTSAFKYRPKTLNTATATPSDKNQEQVKPSNISSRKSGTLNRNEPVYATVGSVNSNQRLVKNLKSANVWQTVNTENQIDVSEDEVFPSFNEVMI